MLLVAHVGFFVFGTLLVLVGGTQVALAEGLGVALEGTGALAGAVSLGLGVGVVAGGPPTDRWPRRPLFAGAALVAAAGLGWGAAGRDVASVAGGLALAGAGAGFFETILNTVVAEQDPLRAERRLASVHAAATAGAVVAPPLLASYAEGTGFGAAFLVCAAAFAALGLLGLVIPLPRPGEVSPRVPGAQAALPIGTLLPLLAASAAYVGLETALTAFAPAFADGPAPSSGRGVAAISMLWLGLLLGRVAFLATGRSADAGWLFGTGLLATAMLALGLTTGLPGLIPGFFALGFVLGVVFPVLIAVTARRFPARRGTAVGLVAGAGAVGGTLLPWAAGAVGDRVGLAGTWGVLVASCATLAVASGFAVRRRRA